MRVDDNFNASSDLRSLQVERTAEAPQNRQSRPANLDRTGDSAGLSALGVEVSRALAGDSPQEIARVERTQEAVAAGNFQEPAGEIADALIDSALSDAALGRQARAG